MGSEMCIRDRSIYLLLHHELLFLVKSVLSMNLDYVDLVELLEISIHLRSLDCMGRESVERKIDRKVHCHLQLDQFEIVVPNDLLLLAVSVSKYLAPKPQQNYFLI